MMNISARQLVSSFMLLLSYLTLAVSQNQTTLELSKITTTHLQANKHEKYSLILPESLPANTTQSLFISAESPFNDPFEQPYMSITSSEGFSMSCDDQAASYTGICKIDQKELRAGRQFVIQVYCVVDCTLKIGAYLSQLYALQLGKSIQISSMADYGLAQLVRISVPADLNFSTILILAKLQNYETVTQGVTMVASYGPNVPIPSRQSYMTKASPTYGHRLSIALTPSSVKPGQQINLYIFLGANNTITLSSYTTMNELISIKIGNPVIDFTTDGQAKKFVADLGGYQGVQGKDVMVKFVVYTGSPEIKLGFDEGFTLAVQDNWYIENSFVYLLTPAFRRQKNFTNRIYLKVTSFFLSSFYLQLIINNKPFILLENNLMQLVKILPDGLQNFIYEDENYLDEMDGEDQGMVRYKATVEMIEGAVEVGIRNCDSLMSAKEFDLEKCLIKDLTTLKDKDVRKSFDNVEGQMKRYFSTYEISFSYNVTKCPKASQNTHLQRYICDFHILLHSLKPLNSPAVDAYLGLEMRKYSQPKQLKQGIPAKDTVPQEQYNYYSFELPSTQGIAKLEFYTTVIQGDLAMLISRKVKYPDFQELGPDVKMSLFGSYVLEGDQIKNGTYYIAIYGYEMTDYTISVAIQRSGTSPNTSNETSLTEIQLQKGLSQSFTMGLGKDLMKFVITPTKTEQAIIKVTSITGTINFKILQKSSQTLICDSTSLSYLSNPQCNFPSKKSLPYQILITGSLTETQTFVISYTDVDQCSSYPINIPMYLQVRLDEDDGGDCFVFSLYRIQDMEVTVALSDLDKIRAKGLIAVWLEFKGSSKQVKLDGYEKVLSKTQLELLCTQVNSNQSSLNPSKSSIKCQFQLSISVNSTAYKAANPSKSQKIQLMIAVQGFDDENVLFDGIPQKIISQKLSTSVAKNFYYFIYETGSTSDLTIYLTSQTNSDYQLAARVVSDTVFGRDVDGVEYPTFNCNITDTEVVNSSAYSPITVLNVRKERLGGTGQEVGSKVVLISVYGLSSDTQKTYIFKIQATQKTTTLAYGESKLGYVDYDQMYEYEIYVDGSTPSVLSVRPLGLQKCMASYVVARQFVKQSPNDEGKYITTTAQFDKIRPFNSQKGTRKILIKGMSQQMCTYQISHNSLNSPLQTILKGVPYQLKIETIQGSSYYIYTSPQNSNESLNILQLINSGNSLLYIMPVLENSTESIEQLLGKNIESFTWKGELNGNVFIDRTDPAYCRGCAYLIVARGQNIVNGEIMVNLGSSPIPLKEGSILKDKLAEGKQNSYLFYSASSFNITITPLYGRLTVQIISPNPNQNPSKTVSNISTTTTISFPIQPSSSSSSSSSSSPSIDYFDSSARYIINVTAIKDSNYFIEVKKREAGVRLYEGMPVNVELGGQPVLVDFVNYDRNAPINILVENLNYYDDPNNQLTFEAYKINHQGIYDDPNTPSTSFIITNKSQSEGSYNLRLYSQSADYSLEITSTRPTKISLILAKVALTHLVATRTLMYTFPATFQIFSPGDSIMIEIFSCLGDIQVMASSSYGRLANGSQESVVRMEHANYGGHYVISAEDLKGEYYVQTKSLAPTSATEQLSYLISYYLYSQQQKIPYKLYGLRNSYIQYSYKPNSIQFRLNKIHRKDSQTATGQTIYTLYISNSSQAISKMTKCSIGQVYRLVKRESQATIFGGTAEEWVSFSVQESQLKSAIGAAPFYYVGGQAAFMWKNNKPHHVKAVYFVYDISQMVTGNEPEFKNYNKTDNTFFILLWIVVPFAIGSFVFYLAVKYFISSIRQGPNQLVEEDDYGNSNENFAGQSQGQDAMPNFQANLPNINQSDSHNPDKYAIQ